MISTLLTTLLIINAVVLLFLIVVLQHGNEGGFGGSLGGGNTQGFFGASGGVKTIIRATWIAGLIFFVLALTSAWVKTHERYALKNDVEKELSMPASGSKDLNQNKSISLPVTKPITPVTPTPVVPAVPNPTTPDSKK